MTTCAFIGSSEAMGSSAKMILGSCIKARAIATRCCWPPESASARLGACSDMPKRSRIDNARKMSACGQTLNTVAKVDRRFKMPCSTFDATSMRGTKLNCWKIIAHWLCHARFSAPCRAKILRPSKRISPSDASVRRFIIRKSVDFPAPDRPMMPTNDAPATVKLA